MFLSINNASAISRSFTLTATGGFYLAGSPTSYQLLAASRVSFIGCWLVMVPSEPILTPRSNAANNIPKQLFIYRDSFSKQDFSRLARVIKQLGDVT
ncbi:hypothetical protein CMT41_14105 [Colwellia sp. MT41]|uniref:Uncharacterized protein n=1 Tax=Colwellia marinimaniae TaxID=1513592 RepID=A0ABQ0MU68_9GAMM|nr:MULTISPECIES: hypothetical protein [unclassified Colwellia]ALO35723.1 hypothetical protein CMT41_14105 [Colwellia sp. MT41]GAW95882.1 hypothetical protein MTCD1_01488 [Colwellia marinimaniae]